MKILKHEASKNLFSAEQKNEKAHSIHNIRIRLAGQ
jgi:hypothetical protein